MAAYDADWWVKRIAITSGALTVLGLIWRPVTKWLRERFDQRVTDVLRRRNAEVRSIMKESVFPQDIELYLISAEKARADHAKVLALAEANEDRLEGVDGIVKAQGVALLDIPRIAGQMEGLPAAIQTLTTTMMAIHKEVGEIRGEMKGWDGAERRTRQRKSAGPHEDGDGSSGRSV